MIQLSLRGGWREGTEGSPPSTQRDCRPSVIASLAPSYWYCTVHETPCMRCCEPWMWALAHPDVVVGGATRVRLSTRCSLPLGGYPMLCYDDIPQYELRIRPKLNRMPFGVVLIHCKSMGGRRSDATERQPANFPALSGRCVCADSVVEGVHGHHLKLKIPGLHLYI